MSPNLMSAFGFDEDDLTANRDGRLTEHQRLRLEGLYLARRGWWWQTIALILGIQAVGWVFALLTGNLALRPSDLPYLAGFFLMMTVIVALVSVYSIRLNRRLISGKLSQIEGAARLRTGSARGTGWYRLRIGWRQFPLMSRAEYEALESGTCYRVYYVAVVPVVILAIEVIH